MKNSYSTVDLLRFLGLFEARPVIFSCHLICNGSSIFLVSLTFRVFLKKKLHIGVPLRRWNLGEK